MKINKIIQIMKVLTLIAGLCLIFIYFKYDTSDCNTCSFELEGKSVGIDKFVGEYMEECINNKEELGNLNFVNEN